MGQTVVLPKLHPLGIDEDHPHLLGGGAHEHRRDQRVDARRLAGTGLACDEQMGHGGQVDQDVLAVDVSTQRNLKGVGGPVGFF